MNVDKIFEIAKRIIGTSRLNRGEKSEEEIALLVANVIHQNAGPGTSCRAMSVQGTHFRFKHSISIIFHKHDRCIWIHSQILWHLALIRLYCQLNQMIRKIFHHLFYLIEWIMNREKVLILKTFLMVIHISIVLKTTRNHVQLLKFSLWSKRWWR